jgi:FkbM family methyltransferase
VVADYWLMGMSMFKRLRKAADLLPPLGRRLRDLRDWRAMTSLRRVQSPYGFTMWGGNYFATGIEESELAFVASELPVVDLFVDCGANAGLFTCLAASRNVPVIAIEPCSSVLPILYKNLTENTFTVPIEVYPVALGERAGLASLYGRGQGASLIPNWGGMPTFDSKLTSVVPLDAIVGKRFDGKRIMLKIDVEGGEWAVLSGAKDVLAQRPKILLELSLTKNQPDRFHPHFLDILKMFWDMNYRISDVREPGQASSLVTRERVDRWFSTGGTDLAGENVLLLPA